MPRRLQHGDTLPYPLRQLNKRQLQLDPEGINPHGIAGSPLDASNPKKGDDIDESIIMTLENCNTMITPACLRALYDMPPGNTSISNNTLGVVEYTPQAFLQKDLDLWFKRFSAPDLVGQSPLQVLIDGASVQTQDQSFNFNGESALDLQYAMELVYPQKG